MSEQETFTTHVTQPAQRENLVERIEERAEERGVSRNQCVLEALRFWLYIDETLDGKAAYWDRDVGDEMRFTYFRNDFSQWLAEVADE